MERIYLPVEIKRFVRERAQNLCEYCRCPAAFSPDPFVIEHIIPLARKGKNKKKNLALACHGCNSCKHVAVTAYDSYSRKRVRLFHPRQHRWHEHFTWSEDYSLIIGLTPIGRATVTRMQLNREGAVNLRRALHNLGLHPQSQSDVTALSSKDAL